MKTMLAMLGGAALGAGAALLLAPQSGRATRSFLRDKATRYSHDVSDFVGSRSRHLRNKIKGIRHESAELMARGEQLINEGRDQVEAIAGRSGEMIERGKDAVDKMKSSMDAGTTDASPRAI
jgi:gas vesicle protein